MTIVGTSLYLAGEASLRARPSAWRWEGGSFPTVRTPLGSREPTYQLASGEPVFFTSPAPTRSHRLEAQSIIHYIGPRERSRTSFLFFHEPGRSGWTSGTSRHGWVFLGRSSRLRGRDALASRTPEINLQDLLAVRPGDFHTQDDRVGRNLLVLTGLAIEQDFRLAVMRYSSRGWVRVNGWRPSVGTFRGRSAESLRLRVASTGEAVARTQTKHSTRRFISSSRIKLQWLLVASRKCFARTVPAGLAATWLFAKRLGQRDYGESDFAEEERGKHVAA